MDQINKYVYELNPGEPVQVQVVPTGVTQPHVLAALNEQPLSPSPAGELSFQFVFPGNETILLIEGDFVDPQPDSRYDIFIRASNEEEKRGPTLDPKNESVGIEFRTRTGPPKIAVQGSNTP